MTWEDKSGLFHDPLAAMGLSLAPMLFWLGESCGVLTPDQAELVNNSFTRVIATA